MQASTHVSLLKYQTVLLAVSGGAAIQLRTVQFCRDHGGTIPYRRADCILLKFEREATVPLRRVWADLPRGSVREVCCVGRVTVPYVGDLDFLVTETPTEDASAFVPFNPAAPDNASRRR